MSHFFVAKDLEAVAAEFERQMREAIDLSTKEKAHQRLRHQGRAQGFEYAARLLRGMKWAGDLEREGWDAPYAIPRGSKDAPAAEGVDPLSS